MYVPALARAHLAAEPVISANKVSLGLKGVAGDQWGEGEEGCLLQRPTLCSRNTYTRVHIHTCASECTVAYTYTRTCGRSFLRTRGDNKICDNQPQRRRRRHDALSDELSGDVRHVTCTSAPLLSFCPFSCLPFLRPSFYRHPYLSLFLHLPLFVSISIIRFYLRLSFSSFLLCPHVATRRLVQLAHVIPPYPLQASCSHHYGVLRGRKLSSFHDRLPCTIRQQFVPTIKTRRCNSVLCFVDIQ